MESLQRSGFREPVLVAAGVSETDTLAVKYPNVEVPAVATSCISSESHASLKQTQAILHTTWLTRCTCIQALGMMLPEQPLTADSICAAVGPDTRVPTINVKTQVWHLLLAKHLQ